MPVPLALGAEAKQVFGGKQLHGAVALGAVGRFLAAQRTA
jgi:hypothetical protein